MKLCMPSVVLAVGIALAAPAAFADVLVLDDALQGSTIGTFDGGSGQFVPGGWKITNRADAIYWRLPYTVYQGTAEFSVSGLNPNECRVGLNEKSELFHMYESTPPDPDNPSYNADTNYGLYRDGPFKHFIRKNGCLSAYNNTIDCLELVLVIAPNYQEPDTRILGWNPGITYTFREKWWTDNEGNCIVETYRGQGSPPVFTLERTMSEPGSWSPQRHSVRIGRARMNEYSGAPLDAVFSNVKVWDTETASSPVPLVTHPGAGKTVDTRTPRIRWAWTYKFNRYQARVTTGNSPDTGVVWDSGTVVSVRNHADVPANLLASPANYYVWVRLGNGVGWSNWSAAGQWFRVDTSYAAPNHGIVQLFGNAFRDNRGPFLGLGFTYMEGLGFCKRDRDRFESDVAFMASRGFNYMRILSEVPGACDRDYWYGRSINASNYWCQHYPDHEPERMASAWPDYDQQFKDMIDIAHDRYGVRTEITIFGGAGESFPTFEGRQAHCQKILDLIAGREHKVIFIEIANEAWQTGFDWPQGREDLRALCKYVADRTDVPVAITSMNGTNEDMMDLYLGSAADIATEHFTRESTEQGWKNVRDCWRAQDAVNMGVPPVSSDEPVGPGSSVYSETDPIKLVSAACFAWISKLPAYVFHSRAGVRGDYRFEDMAGVNNFGHLTGLLPADLPNWVRNDGKEPAAPFTVYCDGYANQYWTDPGRSGATSGCHRNIGSIKCFEFVCYPQGIRSGGLTLAARRDMSFDVYNPLTGAAVQPTTTLAQGNTIHLPQGPGAYIIKGTFPGSNSTPPGPVVQFAVSPGDRQNVLTWQNPHDVDFWATRIVCRTDRFPTSPEDGTLVCDRPGTPGAGNTYTHGGLSNGVTYYYAAFAYDCVPNYASAALAAAAPWGGLCLWESFTYPDGNLDPAYGWTGPGTGHIRIANGTLVIEGGAGIYVAARNTDCGDPGTGYIKATVKVKAGFGEATMWSLWFDDPSGRNLARWYGKGTTARGRIAGTSDVTAEQSLTGSWDTLTVKIHLAANVSEFIFNGTHIGTLSHAVTEASDTLGRIWFERIDNGLAAGHYIFFDDLMVGERVIPGDFNHDDDLDQEDFGHLQACLGEHGMPYEPGCENADLDGDRDVDINDVILFAACMSGPGQPSPCAGP